MTSDLEAVILCELQSTDRITLSDKFPPSYRDYITSSLYHFLAQFAVFNVIFQCRYFVFINKKKLELITPTIALKCLAFCFTLCTTASTIFGALGFAALFINRPLNFLLITWFDFFLFLFNQTNHFDI